MSTGIIWVYVRSEGWYYELNTPIDILMSSLILNPRMPASGELEVDMILKTVSLIQGDTGGRCWIGPIHGLANQTVFQAIH